MIRKKINLLLLGFLLFTFSYAQTRTLSGRVTSPGVSEGLTGAGISVFEFSSGKNLYQGISGQDGSFTISGLPAVKIIIEVSFLGYKSLKEETDLSAGDISNYLLTLEPAVLEMGEVIVSSLRQDKMLRDVSLPLAVVNSADIGNSPAITPADLFTSVPGVNMARDGIWATSMNIRGLSEQRIVTLVDGNRIETASDVAAGMAMIDLNDIERVEVIKGAASSLYGTGAMGGVVNIITKGGQYSEGLKANGSLAGIYQTVNKMHSENMELTLSDDKWYTRISGTLRDAQNTMTPAGELLNSQFSDNNLSLKAGVKPLKNHEFTLNYQRFSAQDVGIPGGSAFPATATATYPDELRSMLAATYSIKPRGKSLGLISFKYFHQYIVRDVELKPNAAVTITPSGYHTTNGFQLQSDWNIKENHQLIAGIDLWQRYLTTEREKTIRSAISDSLGNIIGENITIRGEIPIPDAWFTSGGVFVQDQISLLQNKLSLSLGGRADLINTQNDQAKDPVYLMVNGVRNDNPPKQRITFEANNQNNYSWSLDAGLLFHMTAKSDLSLSLSKAYRAPSIEERFKYIDLGSLVKLGDPKLKPEEGYSADLGLRIWTNKFRFNASVFGNRMTN
ncbi:MAG: TonB-dependent receptor, partial [Bacteroidales bacterium]|nr:TonB-dependent receptor [Bacteroidales bacterium]